ncbi:hypothetical protein NMG60_11000327 [Bertholletia excelsa]
MGAPSLRMFLQSLCQNSLWNYAVFWKLQHENQIFLTWEDGCCGYLTSRESTESGLDEICFHGSNERFSSNWHQAVLSEAGVQYYWGEGVVGEVAYSGKHCWVSCDSISAGEFEPKVVPEWPGEWLPQFAAGIKTIVLIPVLPHGVLQLGSLEKVGEDLALVAYVRDKFSTYQHSVDLSPWSSMLFPARTSSLLMPSILKKLDDLSSTVENQMKFEDPKAGHVLELTNEVSTVNQMKPMPLVPNAGHLSGNDIVDTYNGTRESEISFQSMSSMEVSRPYNLTVNDPESEMIEGSSFGYSTVEEEVQALSYSDNYNMGIFGDHANLTMDSYSNVSIAEQPFIDVETENEDHRNVLHFPMDCELHKALGPAFQGLENGYLYNFHANEDVDNSSSQMNRDIIHGSEPSTWKSGEWFALKECAGHLLEAVVDPIYGGLPNKKLSIASSEQLPMPTEAIGKSEESEFVEEKRVDWNSVPTVHGAWGQNSISKSVPAPSLESVVCALTKDQKQNKDCDYLQNRKVSRVSNSSKRRARPGENPRPRPRDRQLIQDRVKELRELVPNGSKCSIDGLLDRTIKHMLFLRGAMDQADKLKQWVHQKVTAREDMRSSGTCNSQNGTSWAFELGSDLQVCPIVVEDLEYPGHMLIEMLCNDHGLFLEIAEVIQHLGLTILKGVMESRTDNTWAHFIVEASRGFHRLDIFWPLLRLLQQNPSPITS